MSPNISGNVAKHSRECHQTFKGTLLNIPGNAAKHSGEYPQTFRGMLPNLPGANIFGVNKENYWQSRIYNLVKHPRWRSSSEIVDGLIR